MEGVRGYPSEVWWAVIDRAAFDAGLSRSGLALAAGVDSCTFNPSKRAGRYPLLSTIQAVCVVCGWSPARLAEEVEAAAGLPYGLPMATPPRNPPAWQDKITFCDPDEALDRAA